MYTHTHTHQRYADEKKDFSVTISSVTWLRYDYETFFKRLYLPLSFMYLDPARTEHWRISLNHVFITLFVAPFAKWLLSWDHDVLNENTASLKKLPNVIWQWFSKHTHTHTHTHTHNHWGHLWKCRFLGKEFDLESLGWGPVICTLNTLTRQIWCKYFVTHTLRNEEKPRSFGGGAWKIL